MHSILSILAVVSAVAGILLMWLILRRFFSVKVSLLASIFIVFGTNYFRWIFFDGATPHNFLFTCFAAVIFLTLKWHSDQKWRWIILLFPVTVLACFIHDLSMLILVFPILYGIHDRESWFSQRERIRNNPFQYLFLLMIVAGVIILTRFPWFVIPGTVFYYGDPEASVYPFLASNAHLILWSFKKGWLIYTPMMFLTIPGMYFLAEKEKKLFFGIFFFFLFWFLLASSNMRWADDQGFGQRFFIETYVVLALPLGFFLDKILLSKNRMVKLILVFPFFFILLNLFQTWQFTNKILIPEKMNREAYFALFGKTKLTPEAQMFFDKSFTVEEEKFPENKKYRSVRMVALDFEVPASSGDEPFYNFNHAHSGRGSWILSKEQPFSKGLSKTIGKFRGQEESWLRISGWIFFECPPEENRIRLVVSCDHQGIAYKYVAKELAGKFLPGHWHQVNLDYLLPQYYANENDMVKVYFYNYGNQVCLIDDLTIDLFNPEKE